MTVLYGIKYANGIAIGSDRLIVIGNQIRKDTDKLITGNNFILGFNGTVPFPDSEPILKKLIHEEITEILKESTKYPEIIQNILLFFHTLNKGIQEYARNCKTYYFSNPEAMNMGFIFGLNYNGALSLHYSQLGLHITSVRHSVIAVPEQRFTEEVIYTRQQETAIKKIKQRIKEENKKHQQYCGGMEIILMTKNQIKRVHKQEYTPNT